MHIRITLDGLICLSWLTQSRCYNTLKTSTLRPFIRLSFNFIKHEWLQYHLHGSRPKYIAAQYISADANTAVLLYISVVADCTSNRFIHADLQPVFNLFNSPINTQWVLCVEQLSLSLGAVAALIARVRCWCIYWTWTLAERASCSHSDVEFSRSDNSRQLVRIEASDNAMSTRARGGQRYLYARFAKRVDFPVSDTNIKKLIEQRR